MFENETIPDEPPEKPDKPEEPKVEEPSIPEQVPEEATEEVIKEDVRKKPNNPPEEVVTDNPVKPSNPQIVKKPSSKVKARTSNTGDIVDMKMASVIGTLSLIVMLGMVAASIRRRLSSHRS